MTKPLFFDRVALECSSREVNMRKPPEKGAVSTNIEGAVPIISGGRCIHGMVVGVSYGVRNKAKVFCVAFSCNTCKERYAELVRGIAPSPAA